ncbi:hypothetical protein AYO20_05642 [Fonsecaea nubica]|uniref:F-box domain-containing protein n=1 Tax=Fonsecaea nubica TaxID=856822 RepID=A0A178D205_9EURO|nr:hypothetical protein AYO20_05642 [Fonsecaea nubica]OAL35165.1 hypothetical protein AYO20_05642 [Fonsecaea nubica]
MVPIPELPTEILAQIVRYAHLNGDLPNLRLSNSRSWALADHQSRLLLDDLCSKYGISARVRDRYLTHKQGNKFPSDIQQPDIIHIMAFGNFLRMTGLLAADLDRAMIHLSRTAVPTLRGCAREPFVLFEIFNQVLNSSLRVSNSATADLLVPSPDAEQSVSKQFSEEFVHFLRHELTLEDLEGIIGAISVCSMRLWSSVFLFRPKDSSVSSFGSLSGASFNIDQAILTEHVIWKGPLWASQILKKYGLADVASSNQTEVDFEIDDILVRKGIWSGSRSQGARLAANGVARLLWKERQQRIEAQTSASAERTSITEPSVWRRFPGEI